MDKDDRPRRRRSREAIPSVMRRRVDLDISTSDESDFPDSISEPGSIRTISSGERSASVCSTVADEERQEQTELLEKFKELATAEGVNTFGDVIEPHEVTILRETLEVNEIGETIKKCLGEDYPTKQILVGHFNYYCAERVRNPEYLLPAEFSIYPFSLKDGLSVQEGIYGMVDNGTVPLGLRAEAKEMADHIQIPTIDQLSQHYGEALSIMPPAEAFTMIDINVNNDVYKVDGRPCIFVPREHIAIADRCMKYLKLKHSETENAENPSDEHNYRFLPVSMLLMHLGTRTDICRVMCPGFRNEGEVERLLEYPKYSYCLEMACPHHQRPTFREAVDKCSKTIVCRQIYNILQYFCFQQRMEPTAAHLPILNQEDVIDRGAKREVEQENSQKAKRSTRYDNPRRRDYMGRNQ